MSSIPWKDQYRHPLWQKKRLEAMQAAEFACENCFDTETTLNVHHKRYVKGRNVWEYELHELVVLCEPCHQQEHADRDRLHDILDRVPTMMGPWREACALVAGFYVSEHGIADAVDLDAIFKDAPFQFSVGVIAGALYFDQPHKELLHRMGASSGELLATPPRWEYLGRGFEFLQSIREKAGELGAAAPPIAADAADERAILEEISSLIGREDIRAITGIVAGYLSEENSGNEAIDRVKNRCEAISVFLGTLACQAQLRCQRDGDGEVLHRLFEIVNDDK